MRSGRAGSFFRRPRGCVAVADAGEPEARVLLTVPRDGGWDLQHIGRFIRHTNPPARTGVMMAPIRRHGAWGAMVFSRPQPAFDHDDGRLLARITAAVSEAIQFMDRERMLEVRDRIDRRIMEQIHPKDLFYQILAGLRSLTHYDHSSALLIRENGEDSLRVVAEQISWTKARSHRIGLTVPVDAALHAALASAEIHGFDRHGDVWSEWTGKPVARLAEMLDYNRGGSRHRRARSVHAVCAARRARRHVRHPQGRGASPGKAHALRCRARRSFSLPGRRRYPEPDAHRITAGSDRDGRAQARDR